MDVYWSVLPEVKGIIRAQEPISVAKTVIADKRNRSLVSKTPLDNFEECPAVVNALKNYYAIPSIYDYEVEFTSNGVQAKNHNEEFFHTAFVLRNRDEQLLSLKLPYIFFCEQDLEVTQMQPFMERSYINDNCMIVPGKFNISKWFRGFEFTCYLKPSANNTFKVQEKEILYYLQFHTNEKINFKRFHMSNTLLDYFSIGIDAKEYKRDYKNLDYFYNFFKKYNLKGKILKEIKNNL